MSRLSVIITAFNEGDYLLEAVRSVQSQTFANLEIILVDDGSRGHTKEVIDSLANEPRLRIIRQANQGPSAARNTGLLAAASEYVGFLDGDDLWYPDKASRQIEILEQQPSVDLTYSWVRVVDENGHDTGRRRKPNTHLLLKDLVSQNRVGSTSNIIARKEALIAAGLFDQDLRAAVDLEFYFRMARIREGNLRGVPQILLDYRIRRGQITKDWQTLFREWEKAIAKIRNLEPEIVAAVEYETYAIQKRYLAYLAYEGNDYPEARRLLFEALRLKPNLLLDQASFFTITGILSTYLPRKMHAALAKSVQNIRVKMKT
jgi:glycosyltransferase involved in cell wall biosynthesis